MTLDDDDDLPPPRDDAAETPDAVPSSPPTPGVETQTDTALLEEPATPPRPRRGRGRPFERGNRAAVMPSEDEIAGRPSSLSQEKILRELNLVIARLKAKTIEAARGSALVAALRLKLELFDRWELMQRLYAQRELIQNMQAEIDAFRQRAEQQAPGSMVQ